MSIKQAHIFVCDNCQQEIKDEDNMIITQDVPHERSSEIINIRNNITLQIGGEHFCNGECLIQYIIKKLKLRFSA